MDKHTLAERQFRIDEFANGLPFHEGPLKEVPTYNGVFIEDILHAAKERLEEHQNSEYRCTENDEAIQHITCALYWLEERTKRRVEAGVEGTHKTMPGEG